MSKNGNWTGSNSAYDLLRRRCKVYMMRHNIDEKRFAEVAGLGPKGQKFLRGKPVYITLAEYHEILDTLARPVPDGVILGAAAPELHDPPLPTWEREAAREQMAEATNGRSELERVALPEVPAEDGLKKELQDWINKWLVSRERLSTYLGLSGPYVSLYLNGAMELSPATRERIEELITAPGLPPREVLAKLPRADCYGMTHQAMLARRAEIKAVYDQHDERQRQQDYQQHHAEMVNKETPVTVPPAPPSEGTVEAIEAELDELAARRLDLIFLRDLMGLELDELQRRARLTVEAIKRRMGTPA